MKLEVLRTIVFAITFIPLMLPVFALIMVSVVFYVSAVTLLYLTWLVYNCACVTLFGWAMPYDTYNAWLEFDFSREWSGTCEVVYDVFSSLLKLFKLP